MCGATGPAAPDGARARCVRVFLAGFGGGLPRCFDRGRRLGPSDFDARFDPDGDGQVRFGRPSDALEHSLPELIRRDLAGNADGYRIFSRKMSFPADAAGLWIVDVLTPQEQLLRRLRFSVDD